MASNRQQLILDLEKALEAAGDDVVKLSILIGKYDILEPGNNLPTDAATAKEAIISYIEKERSLLEDKRDVLRKRSRDLRKKLQELRKRQAKCAEFFDNASKELAKMSMFTTCQLYRICQDYKQQFQTRSENLKRGRLKLLLTGEICAGKSSVLCKLMGGAYLPVDHGPCTRIPCEVVHSNERKAYLFYKNNPCAPTIFELCKDENGESWNRLRECIVTGKDQAAEIQSNVEKVQIFWPIIVLTEDSHQIDSVQENNINEELPEISFVDVPGIVDKDETLEALIPYMKDTDAHIIVLNNADHQGIDKNRVVALMEQIQRILQQRHGTFQPKLALFLCNKWDRVDKGKRDKLSRDIGKSLRGIWPRVTNEQLVPCVASDTAIAALRGGSVEDMYADFFMKMCGFLETAIRIDIEVNSWWLASILDRCISLNYRAQHERSFFRENKKLMSNQLKSFEKNIVTFDANRKLVDQAIDTKTDSMRKEVKDAILLSLKNNKATLCDWKETTFPKYASNESWAEIQNKMSTAIVERLESHIVNDTHIQNIKINFDTFVKDRLLSLINEYQKLLNDIPLIVDLADGMDEKLQALNVMKYDQKEKIILPYVLSVLAVLIFPLAPVILLFWQIYDELSNTEFDCTEQDFLHDPTQYLKNQTEYFIDSIMKNKLISVAEAAIQDATRNAKFTIYFLHNSTEVYLNSVKSLLTYLESNKHEIDSVTAIGHISENLKQFVVEDIVQDNFENNHLTYNLEDPINLIDEGNCTSIHKGEIIIDGVRQTIVVKKIKRPRGDGNFPDTTVIMRELFLFQMLSHKPFLEKENFIKFFGFQTISTEHEFYLLLVTELCDFSLESMIKTTCLCMPRTSEKVGFPGQVNRRGVARAFVLDLSLQVAKGIRFLHRYNVVHRDIKPGNFVVQVNNDSVCVKLIDLGISNEASKLKTHGPYLGTLCYNAPEVKDGGVHSTASDVYSACLIFWELWYGELISKRAKNHLKIPPNIEKIQPPKDLGNIMTSGWEKLPINRPNIMQVVAKLQTLCHTYRLDQNND